MLTDYYLNSSEFFSYRTYTSRISTKPRCRHINHSNYKSLTILPTLPTPSYSVDIHVQNNRCHYTAYYTQTYAFLISYLIEMLDLC